MESKSIVFKAFVVVALLAAIGVVVYHKGQQQSASQSDAAQKAEEAKGANPEQGANPQAALPRLVDLGAGKCIPCKMMEPILDELREEYRGKLEVVFIDVWQNPKEKERYGIQLIPTQIFYDPSGRELYRHEGFFSLEDILAKWKEFGIELEK